MDRISPSEGGDAGSIPAGSTAKNMPQKGRCRVLLNVTPKHSAPPCLRDSLLGHILCSLFSEGIERRSRFSQQRKTARRCPERPSAAARGRLAGDSCREHKGGWVWKGRRRNLLVSRLSSRHLRASETPFHTHPSLCSWGANRFRRILIRPSCREHKGERTILRIRIPHKIMGIKKEYGRTKVRP